MLRHIRNLTIILTYNKNKYARLDLTELKYVFHSINLKQKKKETKRKCCKFTNSVFIAEIYLYFARLHLSRMENNTIYNNNNTRNNINYKYDTRISQTYESGRLD